MLDSWQNFLTLPLVASLCSVIFLESIKGFLFRRTYESWVSYIWINIGLTHIRIRSQRTKTNAKPENFLDVWNLFFDLFLLFFHLYRPQRSCGKVMFLHLSVILFTEGGVSVPGGCLSRGVSQRGLPRPPYNSVRAVHILLECILVFAFTFAFDRWERTFRINSTDIRDSTSNAISLTLHINDFNAWKVNSTGRHDRCRKLAGRKTKHESETGKFRTNYRKGRAIHQL